MEVVEATAVSLTLLLLVMMDLIELRNGSKRLHAGVLERSFAAAATFGEKWTIITSRTMMYRPVVLVNNM